MSKIKYSSKMDVTTVVKNRINKYISNNNIWSSDKAKNKLLDMMDNFIMTIDDSGSKMYCQRGMRGKMTSIITFYGKYVYTETVEYSSYSQETWYIDAVSHVDIGDNTAMQYCASREYYDRDRDKSAYLSVYKNKKMGLLDNPHVSLPHKCIIAFDEGKPIYDGIEYDDDDKEYSDVIDEDYCNPDSYNVLDRNMEDDIFNVCKKVIKDDINDKFLELSVNDFIHLLNQMITFYGKIHVIRPLVRFICEPITKIKTK